MTATNPASVGPRRRPRRRPGRRSGRGALIVVAALLAGSGVIRIGSGAGLAFANVTAHAEAPVAPATCEPDGGAMAMLEALKSRETRVGEREAALADRAQTLSVTETQVTEKLAALVAAEEKLAATMQKAEQASEGDVAQLTAVYENMKPKDAAPVFQQMAPEFAAGFLARMRPDAAAAILSGLDPKAAYTISVLLAGRNATVPKD